MTRIASPLLLAAFLLPACDASGGDTIGARGGMILSDDGRLALTVPPGALDEEVEITIEVAQISPEDTLAYAYDLSPHGTSFAIPATLTFELEPGDMGAPGLSLVSEREGHWYYLADRDLNTADMTLSASATYLSTFAVVVDSPAQSHRTDDDSGK